jgi:hypothetical protein
MNSESRIVVGVDGSAAATAALMWAACSIARCLAVKLLMFISRAR